MANNSSLSNVAHYQNRGGGVTYHYQTAQAPTPTATVKTCAICPSFIAANDHATQRNKLGRATGAPACVRGRVIGAHESAYSYPGAEGQLLLDIANECADFGLGGERAAGVPNPVIEPNPIDHGIKDPVRPKACTACSQFLDDAGMIARFGIPHPVCLASGQLLLPGILRSKASMCNYDSRAETHEAELHRDWHRVRLTEVYASALIAVNPTPAPAASDDVVALPPLAEPPESLPDAVSGSVAAREMLGIRAWRTVEDPAGHGEPVQLPVFDPEHFDEVQRAKIPRTGDDTHPELYRDHLGMTYTVAVAWLHLGATPALNGVAGTGKTEFFRYMAWLMGLPFERVSITSSTELDDLQGKMLFEDGQTVFRYGRIPVAWSRPCVIAIDEPNVGPPDVWHFLRPLTDDSKQLVLDVSRGERIERDRFSFLGMAFNPSWDPRNVGTREISDADGSRLLHVAVPAPTAAIEKSILTERCALDGYEISEATLDTIVGIGSDLRALADENALPIHWGMRQQIKVARLSRWFSLEEAYRLAAGNFLEPSACDQILITVRSHTA